MANVRVQNRRVSRGSCERAKRKITSQELKTGPGLYEKLNR